MKNKVCIWQRIKWENIVFLVYAIGTIMGALDRDIDIVDNILTVIFQNFLFIMFWYGIRSARKKPREFWHSIKGLIED